MQSMQGLPWMWDYQASIGEAPMDAQGEGSDAEQLPGLGTFVLVPCDRWAMQESPSRDIQKHNNQEQHHPKNSQLAATILARYGRVTSIYKIQNLPDATKASTASPTCIEGGRTPAYWS